jgi:hypothetical protein
MGVALMDHPLLLGNTNPLTLNYITDASPAFIRKGTVSREGVYRVQKLNQNFTFFTSSDGFHNIAAFLWRKLKTKLLLASMKSLINSGKLFKYVTLFRKVDPTFR